MRYQLQQTKTAFSLKDLKKEKIVSYNMTKIIELFGGIIEVEKVLKDYEKEEPISFLISLLESKSNDLLGLLDSLPSDLLLQEVVDRMTNYCENYNELRFDDEQNTQYDIDKKWVQENYPEHSILQLKYNDLDTRRNKIQHKVPMTGLQKDFSVEAIENWMEKCRDKYGAVSFVLGLKYDGAACALGYSKEGKFQYAVTRGNGTEGDDITENAKGFSNFVELEDMPIIKAVQNQIDSFEIRGEVLCTKSNFEKHKDLGIKNTRQFAAGSMKLKDSKEVTRRGLTFIPYTLIFIKDGKKIAIKDIQKDLVYHSQYSLQQWLYNKGVNTCYATEDLEPNIYVDLEHQNWKERFESKIKELYEKRNDFNIDIDGLVVKINSYEHQVKAGDDYAMAYKFPNEGFLTKIESIDFQVGKTGRVVPVINYSPIDIMGVTCTRATIHNSEYFDDFNLSIGDGVSITRNGDVIPQLSEVVSRSGNKQISFPKNCPVCNSVLERDGAFHICKNQECPAKSDGAIKSFINAIGLNFLGWTKIDEMIEKGILKSPYDILSVTKEQLLTLDRMGERSADKILSSLEEAKRSLKVYHVLIGLGINSLGFTNSTKISEKIRDTKVGSIRTQGMNSFNLRDFIENPEDYLFGLNGVGPVLEENIKSFSNKHELINKAQEVIDNLNTNEDIFADKKEVVAGGKLNGASFYLTGSLSKPRGKFVTEYIEPNGGVETGKIKDCDYFLAGESATAWKVEEAKGLGKKIISESEFFELIK